MAENNIKQFSLNVENWGEEAKAKGERLVRALILGLYRDVILATPVDTGRARSNWMLSIDTPNRGTVNADDSGAKKNQHSGRSKAMTMVGDAKLRNMGKASRVYISNSLPYIKALEEGHSPQAPNGMLETALKKLKARVATLM